MAASFLKKTTLLLLTAIIVVLVGFLALPHIVDRLVLPAMLAKTPFSFSRAQMSRITPFLVEGSVEVVEGDSPIISVPRFQIRFTPQSLLKKKIAGLVLDHATIHFHILEGRLILPGFTPQSSSSQSSSTERLFLLPLGVESVTLSQCRLVIHNPNGPTLHVVVNGQLLPAFSESDERHRLEGLRASLVLSDDLSGAVTAAASLEGDEIALDLTIDSGALALPEGFVKNDFRLPRFKTLSAALDLSADATTLAVKNYRLDGSLSGFQYSTERLKVSGSTEGNTLQFSLSGDQQTHDYRINSFSLASLINAEVDINGQLQHRSGRLKTSGSVTAVWQGPDGTRADITPLTLTYDGIWAETSGATLVLRGTNTAELDQTLSGGWSIAGLNGLQLSASLDSTAQQLQAELDLKSGPLRLSHDTVQLTSPGAHLDVKVTHSKEQSQARIKVVLTEVSLPENKLRAKNIVFNLPISSAASETSTSNGTVAIESVTISDEHLLGLSADLSQQGLEYEIDGELQLLNSTALQVPFEGRLSWPSKTADLTWALETDALQPGIIPSVLALPADLDFSGRLEARGKVGYDRGFSAQAQAAIVDGSITLSDSGVAIDDLDCSIEFPELPRVQSSPSQRCTAAALDISTLHFNDLALVYRVESPYSLFIERSKLRWCGGTLESGSLRLSSPASEIDTTFFCSRIGLAELLDQFGFRGTEGEGSLNGKLPVRLSPERLEFDDGFLFSTPGAGGIVRFSDTDLLRQGVGAVSEAGFLDYTLQALEDFTYNWTRLSFNSAGDDLLLTLELDGKPSSVLPFKFDKRGMLIKSEQGQGLQYPIRLDVNFRVPLADLFQVGQSLNTIMGNGQ